VRAFLGRDRFVETARGFAMRLRLRAIAACASLILAIAGTAFTPTMAQASLACSFDASGSPVGTQLTGSMLNAPLSSCYFGYTGPGTDFGFTGFSTTNNLDFSGNTAISAPPAVGFDSPTPNNFEAKPTTLTSSGGHATVTFNAPANGTDFDVYQFTVLGTDGSTSTVFNFFCNGTNDDGVNFPINTACALTLNLPSAAAVTATVSASPTAISTGGTSTLTFTLTNPNSGTGLLGLSGVADSVSLPGGVVVAAVPNSSSNCGSFTPSGGATTLAVSGGSLAAGASCTFKVDVTSSTTGSKTIPTGIPSATGAATGVAGTSATLTVDAPLTTTQAVPSTTLTVGSAATPFTPVTASGGVGTLSYALSGGTLPTGLTFSTTTGQITGTPSTTLATTTFTVTVTDQATPTPTTSSKTFSLTVNPALTTVQAVPSTTLTVGSAATPFTPVTASGGTGTLSYALSGGTLPTGLTFSTTTGQISGTPSTALATTTFTVTVTDQTTPTAQTSSKTFNLTVNAALTTVQAVPSTTLTVGSAATPFTPVTASGGTGTLSYALSGGTLPTGLTFSTTTGQISGTPSTTLATTTFTVTVTDQTTPTAQTSSKTFSLTVNPALTTVQAVPSTTLTVGVLATPFTPVTASGGTGTLSYALSGGTLPTGLTFSTTTGQISGTPSTALATTTFTVTVTDQTTPTPQTSSKTFSLTVNTVLTTTQAVPSTTLTVGSAATPFTPVTATGGVGTLSYALSGGTLPTGLSFSTTTGQISGTPSTTLATTTFTVTVTDQTTPTPQTSSKTFNLTVNPALTTVQAVPSTTLITTVAATPFTPVTASGGTGTLSYALSGGTLPTGLNFSTTTGQITGTPTTTLATTTFTVTVSDQTTPTPQSSSKTFNLTVNAVLTTAQAVPSTTLTVGSAATPFTPVTASGGAGTLSYALSGGTLPTGLNFSTTTGQITGTPSTALATTTFTVTVTDQTTPTAQTSSKTFSLTVNAALTTVQAVPSTTLTVGSAATPFTPVTASGGTGTLSYALSGGTLPTGLNFSTTTGQITGTPTATLATTTFTVTVTDQTTPTAETSSKTFSLTVNPALTTVQAVPSTILTTGVAATPFTPVTASGGTGTLSYALSGGTLPTGLNFSTTTGQISGTPTTTLATTTFTVTVTDQTTPTPQTSSKTFSLTVNAPLTTTQAIPSIALTVGSPATPFTPVTAAGGTGTLTYALSGGTLPTGLNFSTTTGQITGTPSTPLATTTFTVTVTDQTTPTAQTSSKTFSLTVNPSLTTVQAVPSTILTAGSATTPFTPVTASGGTGTLSFALSGGTLPTGLNFSTTTGQISGTPTTALATTTFTVTVTDQTTPTAQTSSKTFNLTVNAALTTVQAVPSTTLTVGFAATPFTPVTASGGTGTLSYALSGGTLPTGLNFSTTTGQISGTPSTPLATTTFTVTVTDQTTPTAETSSKTFSLTVNPALTTVQAVPSTTLTVNVLATPFTPVTASGGTGTLSFALSGGTLPTGLNFSTTTGQISGTPTAVLATTTFTVTVTDQTTPTAQTSSKTFNLTVIVPPVTAASASASTLSGVPVTVDLTIGATGGPFTAAQLISLSPSSAGTAVITASGGRFFLTFTPTATFAGIAVATFTISNASATSAPATITFTVTARPDPSKDAEVIGLVNAQAQAAQHLASNQISNFNERLETLHDGECHRDSYRLSVNDTHVAETDPLQKYGINLGTKTAATPGNAGVFGPETAYAYSAPDAATAGNLNLTGDGRGRGDAAKKRAADDAGPKGCGGDGVQRLAAWTGGYVNYGSLSTGISSTGINYLSSGISAGMDYWFSPAFIGGFGVGFGNDKSTIGGNGTMSTAFGYNVALYGSWHLSRHTFLDALVGYGILSFDSSRYITGSSGMYAQGSRGGHQIFGSLTSGYEYNEKGFLISPYGRLTASWSTLDAFTETGGGIFALQYGTETIGSFTGGFGVRTAYEFKQDWGTVTPRMRVEYAHEFAGASTATLAYADLVGLGGSTYALPIAPTGTDYVTLGLGSDFNFLCNWLLSVDYRTSFGQERIPPQMLKLKLGTKF
jgi:uncharacterized protein YhjY with autotransporter beta-barrel domain